MQDSEDLNYFYPTNTLVTGYDIIGFWVSPHDLLRPGLHRQGSLRHRAASTASSATAQGRKMSKSLGNGIDPLEVIAEYGADALRFTLVHRLHPGQRHALTARRRWRPARNFANKLWNATRFVLMNLPEDFEPGLPSCRTSWT